MLPPKMPRLPWSPLGCLAALLAVLDVCRAYDGQSLAGRTTRNSDDRRADGRPEPGPEEHGLRKRDPNSYGAVKLCKDPGLTGHCVWFYAPRDHCTILPPEHRGQVASAKVARTASHLYFCRFYSGPDCEGDYFEADANGVDLGSTAAWWARERPARYVACGTWGTERPAPERWQWPEDKGRLCPRLGAVSLDLRLTRLAGSGTSNTISLAFGGALRRRRLVVAEGAADGATLSKSVDVRHVFGTDSIGLDQITSLGLYSKKRDEGAEDDAWHIEGE